MSKIGASIVWLCRCLHSRGFGIQSPSAYHFVRYVVNEHYQYYAYGDLRKTVTDIDDERRKLCKLYFRIANYRCACVWLDCAPCSDACRKYVNAACEAMRVVCGDDMSMLPSLVDVGVARISLADGSFDGFEPLMQVMGASSIMIVEGIKSCAKARAAWRGIVNDVRTGVTFDLFYCGIVFFDKSKYKRNYIINF